MMEKFIGYGGVDRYEKLLDEREGRDGEVVPSG
jgi:hypothetical protein